MFDDDAELSAIGVTRRQLVVWRDWGLLSFDPGAVDRLERWHLQEIAFLYHLTKVEPSVNALGKFLAPLKRPYLLDHGRHFFNFKTLQWERRFELSDLLSVETVENPERAGQIARALVRQLGLVGAREELFKTLAAVQDAIPDDWLRDMIDEQQ